MSALEKMLDYILESWLPTKLTILISGSTILLTLLAIGLPEYLQKIDIQLSKEITLLLRIVVPLSLLYLGTFWVLLLVLRYYKSEKTDESKTRKLSADSIKILKMIAVFESSSLDTPHCSMPFNELSTAKNLGYTPQQIRFHVEQLEAAKCVSVNPWMDEVSLLPNGRALLHKKKLLC